MKITKERFKELLKEAFGKGNDADVSYLDNLFENWFYDLTATEPELEDYYDDNL